MQVVIGDLRLAIAGAQSLTIDLGIHMAICDEDSRPPAVIEVDKLHSPSQPVLDLSQSRAVGYVVKIVVTAIQIERWSVIAEIGFNEVLMPAVPEVASGKTHAGLLGTIFVVRHTGFLSDVGERTVLVVVIQNAGRRVAGNVDVRPPVMIKITRQ